MGYSYKEFWSISYREFSAKANGYNRSIKIRRSELRAVHYPLYTLFHKANFKGSPIKPNDFLPIEKEDTESVEIIDKDGLLKKTFYAMNPHLKPK